MVTYQYLLITNYAVPITENTAQDRNSLPKNGILIADFLATMDVMLR